MYHDPMDAPTGLATLPTWQLALTPQDTRTTYHLFPGDDELPERYYEVVFGTADMMAFLPRLMKLDWAVVAAEAFIGRKGDPAPVEADLLGLLQRAGASQETSRLFPLEHSLYSITCATPQGFVSLNNDGLITGLLEDALTLAESMGVEVAVHQPKLLTL